MRAGVIDIGSNSIKLFIGEEAGEQIKILESLKVVIPLGRNTFLKGRISQETINQAISILEKYKKVLQEYDVTNVVTIATTAVREAVNRDIFLDTVLRKTGLPIDVLTVGDVVYYIDSYLSYKLKDTFPIHTQNILIAELGAGGLDLSILRKGFTLMNFSLPIGFLRLKQLTSKLDGSSEEVNEAIQEFIENEFSYVKNTLPKIQIDDVILIDENYLYLQNILQLKKQESGFFKLEEKDAQGIFKELADKSVEEISRSYKIPVEIADTMIAYATILNMLLSLIENKHIYILETSLSEAILANILFKLELSEKYNKLNQLISVAKFLGNKYNLDVNHAKHVADLAKTLFDQLKGLLGLPETDSLYLTLAAYLHDIGGFVHNRAHHKHTEYIISSLTLFRLTEEEIKIIACVARYHRKAPPLKTHPVYNSLPPDKQILVQKLSAILRIANALDRSHKQKVQSLEVNFSRSQDVTLVVHTDKNFILEKTDFSEKKDLFEEITGNKMNLAIKS
jgi:exopolyphosphatase/guanosine-5'-triphosphate,3'-diphosphate pyrophosphatase